MSQLFKSTLEGHQSETNFFPISMFEELPHFLATLLENPCRKAISEGTASFDKNSMGLLSRF